MAFLRRRTSIANSRSQNAADEPYKPRNHGVFKLIGALVPRVLNSIRDTVRIQHRVRSRYPSALLELAVLEHRTV